MVKVYEENKNKFGDLGNNFDTVVHIDRHVQRYR